MSVFVLIHGGGDSAWSWHLVEAELRRRGHITFASDLVAESDTATLTDYADAVVHRVTPSDDIVVVGHSFGAFTAVIVAARLKARSLVLLAGTVPIPGEAPGDWWANTGWEQAVATQAVIDGGLTGNSDPYISFYHDVPRELAAEAMERGLPHMSSTAVGEAWPLPAWPDIPTRFILFRDDRFFPAALFRRIVPERLGIVPEEIAGSHGAMLGRPQIVVDALLAPPRDAD